MKHHSLIILAVVVACGGGDGSDNAAAEDSAAAAAAASQATVPLDSLMAALDSGRAAPTPAQFRAHGHDAVARLVDCLGDKKRGLRCWEVLQQITDIDSSRELPINSSDLYVSRDQADVADELNRAQRAWRVVYNSKAYRLKSM